MGCPTIADVTLHWSTYNNESCNGEATIELSDGAKYICSLSWCFDASRSGNRCTVNGQGDGWMHWSDIKWLCSTVGYNTNELLTAMHEIKACVRAQEWLEPNER